MTYFIFQLIKFTFSWVVFFCRLCSTLMFSWSSEGAKGPIKKQKQNCRWGPKWNWAHCVGGDGRDPITLSQSTDRCSRVSVFRCFFFWVLQRKNMAKFTPVRSAFGLAYSQRQKQECYEFTSAWISLRWNNGGDGCVCVGPLISSFKRRTVSSYDNGTFGGNGYIVNNVNIFPR